MGAYNTSDQVLPSLSDGLTSLNQPSQKLKQTSKKKIEANRRNAQRSTGPKTEQGKRAVSRNAVKHGLLVRETLIARGLGAENKEEFIQFLVAHHEEYQPVGIGEELLVQTIATCYWRLARVLRFEMGETRKRLDYDVVLRPLQKMDEVNRNISVLGMQLLLKCSAADENASIEERLEAKQRLQSSLRTHPHGIRYVMDVLVAIKTEIQEKGSLSDHLLDWLMATIGLSDNSLWVACASLTSPRNNEKNGAGCDASTEENTEQNKVSKREAAIRLLDTRLELMKCLLELAEKNATNEIDAQTRSLALPDEAATDKVIRYEAHLNRQLYRAMGELERLQRRRKGENVPPPLNVNLGRRG
jgi:hypothetical protein